MKTADILKKLSDKNIAYLQRLGKAINNLIAQGYKDVAEGYKYTARGYIAGLIDAEIISRDDFRDVWAWFTLLLDR